ncbi:hypothetical protein [Bacillus licheniformis]|uniref:hypothetical protein n=1 Tax=Bacillus licheniformis TaxID=1402 RepID=UPI0013121BBA|nr:hypothetical protein [Bacillus licheniformis]MEC2103647.1 hypothetical protein [Bacillus licheniformis]TWK39160.1 hypothetical protein CHCC20368_2707 [Bacillus licheniformis]
MGERYFNFSLADTNKQLREVNELAAKKVAEFQDFSSKVERVVEYNEILLCTIAGLIAENERLKHTIEEAEELTAELYVRSERQPSEPGVIPMKLPDNLSADQRHIITALHGLLMRELKEGER